MNNPKHKITVFEHQSLHTDRGELKLSINQLKALQQFYGFSGVPYYSLIHNGVKFCEYVGVLQVGTTQIEILPKADKNFRDEESWRKILIDMLHVVGNFDLQAPSFSSLHLKSNSILDLYFELFANELKYLINRGLVKKYRKNIGNQYALKGSLQFGQHINKNLVHQERFFISYTTYDKEHLLHCILYKALRLLARINTNQRINGLLQSILLDFPEMPNIGISETTFRKLALNRKTLPYKKALNIAQLLLLNYHPDISKGSNNVLALLFDMNLLWEQFVYSSIRKFKNKNSTISAQNTKNFWKPTKGTTSKMRPDIILNKDSENCVVLDTKWKNLNGHNPSPEDLRQMFVYLQYFNASKVALIYPGARENVRSGNYFSQAHDQNALLDQKECSVITIPSSTNIRQWQKGIAEQVESWILSTSPKSYHN